MRFSIPQQGFLVSKTDNSVGGSDIRLRGGDFTTTASGDWATVSGVEAARQSVEREILAPKGVMPRRPNWGCGATGMLFKGVTKATRDQIRSAVRASLLSNPRLKLVLDVEVVPAESGQGVDIRVDVDAVDGRISSNVPVRGRP